MQLQWRVTPPRRLCSPKVAISADGLLLFFLASSEARRGKTELLVFDVEERALIEQVELDLERVDGVHVECSVSEAFR